MISRNFHIIIDGVPRIEPYASREDAQHQIDGWQKFTEAKMHIVELVQGVYDGVKEGWD